MPCCPTSASESVSRSSATASRPDAGPSRVSFSSSASRCLSKMDTARLLSRFRGAHLDTAGEAARILLQQAQNHTGNIVSRNLPVGASSFVAVREAGRDRPRHDVADADVVIAQFLHERLAEAVQAGLRRAVCRAAREWILSGEAADVDDVAAAARAQVRDR